MSYVATDLDLSIAKQPYRELFIKIEVLDFNMNVIDEISGNCTSGSLSIDADADVRRTCRVEMVVDNDSLLIQEGKDIWLDRYIKLYVGIRHIATEQIVWYNCGVYLVNKPGTTYSADQKQLAFEGVDLMAKLTGLRNGTIEAITTKIEAGENMRDVLVSTITQLGGFSKYTIDCEEEIPYDITIDVGDTVYDLLSKIRDIYPNYEMFFDLDGVFVFQKIPSEVSDPVILTYDLLKDLVMIEEVDINFEDVKNKITVLGKSLTPDDYGGDATLTGSTYKIVLEAKEIVRENETIGFTIKEIAENPKLTINNGSTDIVTGDIINEDGTPAVFPDKDEYYIVKMRSDGKFFYMGRQQPTATCSDTNEQSPFCVSKIGEIYTILHGGEFDNITTDQLCLERAEYELWKHTRLNDNITLTVAPIYWSDVNTKLFYVDNNSKEGNQYIIKSINTDLSIGGSQTITAIKFYPLYPDI